MRLDYRTARGQICSYRISLQTFFPSYICAKDYAKQLLNSKNQSLRSIGFGKCSQKKRTSLVAQTVKRLPAMWETWVRSLGQEDPLEKEMATHSSTLAWKIP